VTAADQPALSHDEALTDACSVGSEATIRENVVDTATQD